jgi:hypothetical protein
MPSAVSRPIVPFVGDRFEPRGRLGDYARANGRDVAEAMRHQGATSAALWSGIGQNVAGSLRDIAAYPEQQRQAAMLAQRQQREEQAYQAAQAKEQEHAAKAERLKALLAANPGKRPEPQAILEAVGPEDAGAVVDMLDELYPVPKAPEPYTLNPGDVRFGGDNTQVASVPKPEPPEVPPSLQRDTLMVNGKRTVVNFNPKTGQYTNLQGQPVDVGPVPERAPGSTGPRPMTQTAEAALITRLAKDWTTQTKPTRELERQVRIMDAGMEAVRRGDLSQGAQQVLVTFQKILDPPSVVRDSEFWRSANGQSLMNRARGAVERLTKGGVGVTAEELQKFAELARETAKAQQGSYLERVKKRIGATADRYQIPHELIFEAPEEADDAPGAVEEWGFDAQGKLVRKGGG